MKYILFLITPFLFLSCKTGIEDLPPQIKVGGQAFVKVQASNVQDSANIFSSYWPLLLGPHELFTHEYKIISDSTFLLTFNISVPSKHTVQLSNDLSVPVFLVPGDTLNLHVDYQVEHDNKKVSFKGTYASISKYLYDKPGNISNSQEVGNIFRDPFYAGTPEKTLLLFQQASDSLSLRQQNYLEQAKDKYKLPKWYIDYENLESLLYAIYHQRILPDYWQTMMKVNVDVPEGYFEKIKEVSISNSSGVLPYLFPFYYKNKILNSLHAKEQEEKLVKKLGENNINQIKGTKEYQQYALDLFKSMSEEADKLLDKQAFYIFLIHQFFLQVDREGKLVGQEYLKYVESKLAHTPYLSFVVEQYEKFSSHLTTGDNAPGFYLLSDQEEQYLSLSDFRGEVVLLNFWFPGCKPCIAEIPSEKKLIKKYEEQGFNIVNICLEATPEQWQKALQRFELSGVNMVAQGNWERRLKEAYGVGGFPHYVLIDKLGNIIENETYSPSDERLSYLIEKELKASKSY